MPLFSCVICKQSRSPFKAFCRECLTLFKLIQENMGKTGLGQLMDVLIATGIFKPKIKHFLECDLPGKGSIMDQLTAALTNNLAAGIGVKESTMTAEDVKNIRNNPKWGASSKPIE